MRRDIYVRIALGDSVEIHRNPRIVLLGQIRDSLVFPPFESVSRSA